MDKQQKQGKAEKKGDKESKEKKDRVTHYNKPEEERDIFMQYFQDWYKEPLRSPNKEVICKNCLKALSDKGYNSYELQDIKNFFGNRFQTMKRKEKTLSQVESPQSQYINSPKLSKQTKNISQNDQIYQQQLQTNQVYPNQYTQFPQNYQQQQPFQTSPGYLQQQMLLPQQKMQSPASPMMSDISTPEMSDSLSPSYSLFSPTNSGRIEFPSSDKYFLNPPSPTQSTFNGFNLSRMNSSVNKNPDQVDQKIDTETDQSTQKEGQDSITKTNTEKEEEEEEENTLNQDNGKKGENIDHDELADTLKGKQIGKNFYFSGNTSWLSSSSSSSIGIPPDSIKSSSQSVDDRISSLPDIPTIDSELSIERKEKLRQNFYDCIQACYSSIHGAWNYYSQKVTKNGKIFYNESLLNFQEAAEKKFVQILDLMKTLCVEQIYSYDAKIEIIEMETKKRSFSSTTRLYNDEKLTDASLTPSPTNSIDIPPMASSAQISLPIQKSENLQIEDGKSCIIESLSKKINTSGLSKKLVSFFQGKYDEESYKSFDVSDVEASTIVQFKDDDQIDFVYVAFDFNSHVLNFRNAKVETGFYFPATSMHFHEETAKLYICGDVRVKEFSIDVKTSKIKNTKTFFFGKENSQTSVTVVWGNRLVLGFGSTLYVWDIESEERPKEIKKTLGSQANKKIAKSSGIDINKVDWNPGFSVTSEIDSIEQITSLAILGDDEFLAVSSSSYPVIYIYNDELDCISKLVSHTMAVTALKAFNYRLFSGSEDMTTRLWDVNKGEPELMVNLRSEKVTAIENGSFCGQSFLFTGTDKSNVQCTSINKKMPLFEIKLNSNVIPKDICFVEVNKNKNAKLMIVSQYMGTGSFVNIKKCHVQYLEFT